MQCLNISNLSLGDLNTIIDFAVKTCDKIFLTELSASSKTPLVEELKENILDSKRVTKWDGTEIRADEDCKDGIIPEELKPIQHLIKCNEGTAEVLKKYNTPKRRGLFSRDSYFDIAFYNGEDRCFFTTPHEDSICFEQGFYKVISKHISVKNK